MRFISHADHLLYLYSLDNAVLKCSQDDPAVGLPREKESFNQFFFSVVADLFPDFLAQT